MRITEAARVLGTSPRMLRYRESLGLLPRSPGSQRRYDDRDLAAVRLTLELEQRHGVTPAGLANALRVLTEPAFAADVRDLGVRIGRIAAPPSPAEIDRERALRWLGRSGVLPPPPNRPVR